MPPGRSCRAVLFLEKFFDAGDVFGDVHADGVVSDLRDANLPAVFEPAQLFELLDAFELALRQRGVFASRWKTYRPRCFKWRARLLLAVSRTQGMGAREKYSALSSKSRITFTTLGSMMSAGIFMGVATVAIVAPGSSSRASIAVSTATGSSKGSSPCTFTKTSPSM